jgi:hypothetical protein
MPVLSNSVGEAGANQPPDVALVQLMLQLVKNAKQQSYFGTGYTGAYDLATRNAIVAFQTDAKLIAAPDPVKLPAPAAGAEKAGFIGTNSATFKKLAAQIPAAYQSIRALPAATPTIYLSAADAEAKQSSAAIALDPQLEPVFRAKVVQLVQQMQAQHGIALWLTPRGSRRTFAEQAAEVNTHAGPGESNHNFGRAVDIGFKDLTWVKSDAKTKKDAPWLNALEAVSAAKAREFWEARDQIAAALGLYRLNFERVHLQDFNQATVSSGRSLVALLNQVGAMKWDAKYANKAWQYSADLGAKGGAMHPVGTAKDIWGAQATVTKTMLAATWTKQAKDQKAWNEADVKADAIDDYRTRLKAEFEKADGSWMQWKAVP